MQCQQLKTIVRESEKMTCVHIVSLSSIFFSETIGILTLMVVMSASTTSMVALRSYHYSARALISSSCSSSASKLTRQLIVTGNREASSGRWLRGKPNGSEVLTCHLEQNGCPPWTSYFVRYDSIVDDQWGRSHFNWRVGGDQHNYHILRTGCYPYIKYHCSKRPYHDLSMEDNFFRFIKVFNLGLPCLAYGIAAIFMIRHTEIVNTSKGPVTIYFLYAENRGSSY